MSNKDVDEDSWKFIENPICDIFQEENNEPKNLDGFVDSIVYDISNGGSFESLDGFTEDRICEVLKGESMDLVALGNFYMEQEHETNPYNQSKLYISVNN